MIVYVETNFILELAYLRSTSDNCQRLIDLAREQRIAIAIPAFALIEARVAWQNIVKRRSRLHADVRSELTELARSRPLVTIAEQSEAFVAALVHTAQDDRSRIERVIDVLTESAVVMPTRAKTATAAFRIESRLGLAPQDSLVYATVVEHLTEVGSGPKLFVTQNARDFANPTIEDELASFGCKFLTKFDAAEAFVRAATAG